MFSDWVSFLAYPNLFGIKGFVVVVVLISDPLKSLLIASIFWTTNFDRIKVLMKYVGRDESTTFINTSLPAIDKELAEELDNLTSILWIYGRWSILVRFLSERRPR
jgi:hypothetical protein